MADAAVKVEPSSSQEPALSPEEVRSRVITLIAVFIISTVFWLAFYQIFYTFTFWARDNTATTLNPETFQVFEPLGVILLVARSRGALGLAAAPERGAVDAGEDADGRAARGALPLACWRSRARIGGDTGRVSAQWLICGQRHHRARRNLR